jgi:hypothetical protein
VRGESLINPTKLLEAVGGYQEPGPGRDLMHANHAIHDVKLGLLRCREARKTKASDRTIYLGVKGFTPLWSARTTENLCHGLWRSLVAHLTGGQGVAGSNPVSPT